MIDLSKAKLKRRIAKNKFDCDLSSVDSIYWSYKLSKDTISIGNATDLTELEIFDIVFKSAVDTKVFSKIQSAIPYRILFRYSKDNQLMYAMYIGRLLTTDKILVEDGYLNIDAMSINSLIETIVELMADKDRKDNESLEVYISRCDKIASIEREIASIKRQRDNEKQPKRKIELNDSLKKLMKELERLS